MPNTLENTNPAVADLREVSFCPLRCGAVTAKLCAPRSPRRVAHQRILRPGAGVCVDLRFELREQFVLQLPVIIEALNLIRYSSITNGKQT